jgi:hypothetical protein
MPFAILQICIRENVQEKSMSLNFYNNVDKAIDYILKDLLIYLREYNKDMLINDNLNLNQVKILEKYINNNRPIWLPLTKQDGDLFQLIVIEDATSIILDNSTIGCNSIDDLIEYESNTLDVILK